METNETSLLERIKDAYNEQDNCMGDFLAFTTADELGCADMTMEEIFNAYVGAMKWANGDRFYIAREDEEPEEL